MDIDFSDPDGKFSLINTGTVLSVTTPALSNVVLLGGSSAAWEQAVVVYIDGIRQHTQLGSFDRTNIFSLGEASNPRNLMLAGWHKESGPDSGMPWQPSRGTFDPQKLTFGWEDSQDEDFNDYKIAMIDLTGTIHIQTAKLQVPTHFSAGTIDSTVHLLALLAACKKRKRSRHTHATSEGRTASEWLDQAADGLLRRYLETETVDSSELALSRGMLLAAQLDLLAATLHDEDLRREIEYLADRALSHSWQTPAGISRGGQGTGFSNLP